MLSNWRNWCRLCANECAVYKLESLDELNEITLRHFSISLQKFAGVCNCICEECYNFVNKLDRFRERCLQTNKLLVELCQISSDEQDEPQLLDTDIQDLRFRFLSDSIADAAEEAQDVKVRVDDVDVGEEEATAVGVDQGAAVTLDQGVDTSDLQEQELVELMIEKLAPGRRKPQIGCNIESPAKEDKLLTNVTKSDKLLSSLSMEGYTELHSDVPLMHDDASDEDYLERDYIDDDDDDDERHSDLELQEVKLEAGIEVKEEVASSKVKSKASSSSRRKANVRTKCETCDRTFRTRSLYVVHLQNKHPDSKELAFGCTVCPKRFCSERKAKMHEMVHLPSERKMVHPCQFCDKKFSKFVNVQAHIKAVHNGERPYVCEECGKAFGTKGALKEHQITHSDDKPFQCSHCPKTFKNLPRLKTHEDTHNNTLYVCPHCGLQLNTKRTLKMHMVVHSDQKRFKCQYCGNEYKRSKALKNHLILHTGLRPYQCPFCEKTFANGSNCRSHKKKAHPKELAALEASGEQLRATNIPKLEQLQPKPLQTALIPGAAHTATTTSSSSDATTIAISSPPTASQQQQPVTGATTIIAASPPQPSTTSTTTNLVVDTAPPPGQQGGSSEELVLHHHRGVRLVTAYFASSSQSEPPPLNILPMTANIKHEPVIVTTTTNRLDNGRGLQPLVLVEPKTASAAATAPATAEQLHHQHQLTVADMASIPPLQLISTNKL